jgi:hypothetical protein
MPSSCPRHRFPHTWSMTGPVAAVEGSAAWRLIWRAGYRLIRFLDPLIRRAWRSGVGSLRRVIELDVVGRRTGRPRPIIVTCLTVDGNSYVGHPNGEVAWTRNVEASGLVRMVRADGSAQHMRAIRLRPGPERESVVRATWSQQPFPANLLYSAARSHVRRVGVYFRLEPAAG